MQHVVGRATRSRTSTAGDNGAVGIRVGGTGNLITGNNAFRNALDGIGVSGGTAVSPNVVNSNVSGTSGSGNGGAGIALTGTGSGAGGGAGIKGNITRGNTSDGIEVTGSGHKLKNNSSGGSGADGNHACQYRMFSGNTNMSGNHDWVGPILGARLVLPRLPVVSDRRGRRRPPPRYRSRIAPRHSIDLPRLSQRCLTKAETVR